VRRLPGRARAHEEDVDDRDVLIDEQTGELRPSTSATSRPRAARSSSARAAAASASRSRCTGERMTIGRSPEAEVFLDDVTVSREHATLVRRGGEWFLDDSGSLNGTYVNRRGSTRTGSRTATSCRSASSSSPTLAR
jgi:pSer/pThr/pTyr-binding forkhead associated (FHA) protein